MKHPGGGLGRPITSRQEISAKPGVNVELLLDKVLLEAEMLELESQSVTPGIGDGD